MEILTLLLRAAAAGLRIDHEGDELRVRGPRSARSLAQDLERHKEALLDALFLFEERAALMEYEGGLSRQDAEHHARKALRRMIASQKAMVRPDRDPASGEEA